MNDIMIPPYVLFKGKVNHNPWINPIQESKTSSNNFPISIGFIYMYMYIFVGVTQVG